MRILITGIDGYIGSSLFKSLSKDWTYDVIGINRSVVELTDQREVCDFFNREAYFDVVIHCAASGVSRVMEDDWTIMDENLSMYYNLLANKHYYGKFIHFGSGAETYISDKPYGYSKKVIAKSILTQENFYNLRLFGVFDENESNTRFIKANVKRYINREPLQVYEVKFMDLFYMEDLIKVVEYYIKESNLPKEFDCVYSEASYTLRGLALLINKLSNYEVEILSLDINGSNYVSNYRTKLPIEFIGLEQGLINVYNALK